MSSTCGLQNASGGLALDPGSRVIHEQGPHVMLSSRRARYEPIARDVHLVALAAEAAGCHHLTIVVLQLQHYSICTEVATMLLESSTLLSAFR